MKVVPNSPAVTKDRTLLVTWCESLTHPSHGVADTLLDFKMATTPTKDKMTKHGVVIWIPRICNKE